MASLADIRAALAAALSGIPGAQVSAYALSAPTPPCFFVQPGETQYDTSLQRHVDRWELLVTGIVSLAGGDIGTQKRLDEWLDPFGPSSVKAAIEADTTLGGVVHTLSVPRCTGYRVFQREGGGAALGAEWTVVVYARGDQ